MRETSRRHKEFEGDNLKPELLLAVYEAVAAAQLVISGKFDAKILEFKAATELLEEKLELVKTLDDAKAAADKIIEEAAVIQRAAEEVAASVEAREKAVERHELAVEARAQKVKQGEEELTVAWSEQRKAAAAVIADRASATALHQAKQQELEKREEAVEERERSMSEAERKLRAKLELLRAPIS